MLVLNARRHFVNNILGKAFYSILSDESSDVSKNLHNPYMSNIDDSNGKALFLIVRTVQIDSSHSIGIRAIQIDQMDTIFFHSTHACQMVKWYHAVYNTVCRSQSNGSN